ncbi:GAF domain-containing sensor histidine kinase [Cellulomonas sp. URHD0024]|uniref:GAF domain-containing sensor histidine kinase n=1 Tax=Cellulomonas sp. URHD0024 TaxID=1302620 RepID=UPI0004294734|nr:GAF domain-containing protein [Cellulomonas sp. URHD0024]
MRDEVASGSDLSAEALDELLDAMVAVAGELDLEAVLDRFVRVSARLTGARYGAIDVRDSHGRSITFVRTGEAGALAKALRDGPQRPAVLGALPTEGAHRLVDLREHPSFDGFPHTGAPAPGSFLGATLHVGSRVFGHLYLAGKPVPFTAADEKIVAALAGAAGAAVGNAQLYAEAERRETWLRAEQAITTMLLEGVDAEDALRHIASTAREVGEAQTVALALPGVGGELIVELAVGQDGERLVGTPMPTGSRADLVLVTGTGMRIPSLQDAETVASPVMRAFGPALFAPFHAPGRGLGVLILLRATGGPQFDDADLATAVSFSQRAALAYVLAQARAAEDAAALVDERERIARDLHDLAIQQLFATGLQLETVRRRAARGVDPAELTDVVDLALENVDGSVREIRHIVHDLRDPDGSVGLVARLRREVELARTGLGFAPRFVATLDGTTATEGDLDEDRLDERVGGSLASDVVAVVREALANAARHAEAHAVAVRLVVTPSAVLVEVQDDGIGIPADPARRSGTVNLASRARAREGTFAVRPVHDGVGTLLAWSAPLS